MQSWHENPLVKNAQATIYHQRNDDEKLEATVAVIQYDDKNFVGASSCSTQDQFDRKIGRWIAIGRAKKALASYINNWDKQEDDLWMVTDQDGYMVVENAGTTDPKLTIEN